MAHPGVTGEKSQLTTANVPVWDDDAEEHKCVCLCCRCCHICTAGLVIAILSIVLSVLSLLAFVVKSSYVRVITMMMILNEGVFPLAFIVTASLAIVGIQKVRPAFVIPLMVTYVAAIVIGIGTVIMVVTGVVPIIDMHPRHRPRRQEDTYIIIGVVVLVGCIILLEAWCVHVFRRVREYLMSKEKLQQA